jgi:small conductance mechanosensitive channel
MQQEHIENIQTFLISYMPKLGGAILLFVIGWWVINTITRLVRKGMVRREFDVSLQSFLASLVSVVLKVMLLITTAGMLGIQTTSFVAILGAAGLAVGLALQGSLSNFAGGVLTLIFKPYKVGDLIEAQGQTGVVQEIQIFNTILLTSEKKTVILPNGAVSNGTIVNHSRHGHLRIELTFSMAGDTDVEKLRKIGLAACNENKYCLEEPAPALNIQKIVDGDLVVVAHAFCTQPEYWKAYFSLQEEFKKAFDKNDLKYSTPPAK